jgi:hypothetical protein
MFWMCWCHFISLEKVMPNCLWVSTCSTRLWLNLTTDGLMLNWFEININHFVNWVTKFSVFLPLLGWVCLVSLSKGALSPSDMFSNIVIEPWFVLWPYGDDLFGYASTRPPLPISPAWLDSRCLWTTGFPCVSRLLFSNTVEPHLVRRTPLYIKYNTLICTRLFQEPNSSIRSAGFQNVRVLSRSQKVRRFEMEILLVSRALFASSDQL